MKLNIIIVIALFILTGCSSYKKPSEPDRKNSWSINDEKGIQAINKKIVEDRL